MTKIKVLNVIENIKLNMFIKNILLLVYFLQFLVVLYGNALNFKLNFMV